MSGIYQTIENPNLVFPVWSNNLEHEPIKPSEVKKTVEKIEFKGRQKIKKVIEVRSFVIKRRVTKDFLERQQKLKPFGIGTTEDDLRQNVNMASYQRENVWHPYYEVKLEDEDFKEKLARQKREKREAEVNTTDIAEIENKLKSLEEKERLEQLQALASINAPSQKKGFDLKKLQDKMREEEKTESTVQ